MPTICYNLGKLCAEMQPRREKEREQGSIREGANVRESIGESAKHRESRKRRWEKWGSKMRI